MVEAEAGHVSEPEKKKAVAVKSNILRSETQTAGSIVERNPYHQHHNDGGNGNPEEDDEESDEDPDEEVEEDPEEEIYEESDENQEDEDPEKERGKKAVEESELSKVTVSNECGPKQRKHRLSRWDHKQEEEPSEIDGKNKRRKTRWDTNDSQNCLPTLSGFANPLDLLMDPKIISLKVKLMEITKKLQSSEIYDERPAAERSPSPEPVYNNLGIRINTRDARVRKKLMNDRKNIMSKLAARTHLSFKSPTEQKRIKLVRKLFVPDKEYPTYNFIGLILGPKGNTQKKMEKETGAKIFLRGRGSGESEDEDLHVRVEADSQRSIDAAALMIEKLLIPVADQNNDHKRAQLAELAKLRGTYIDNNVCDLCKEKGHRKYACPLQDSTFKAVCCDICGSFGHPTSNCTVSRSAGVLSGSMAMDKSNKEVDPANLYVGYLSHAIDEKRLKELFLPFGKILKTAVIKDQATGLSKGYGFVKFETPSDAAAAVTYMNGYKMDGKMLAVRVAGQKIVPISAAPNSILGQPSYINGPMVSMLPEAPLVPVPVPAAPNSTLGQLSYINGPIVSMLPEAPLIPPPYVVPSITDPMATSSFSSGYDFCDKIPISLPESVSQFPGHPDYPGSQFKSHFTSPAMNETQRQIPDTEKRSSFWSASRFP